MKKALKFFKFYLALAKGNIFLPKVFFPIAKANKLTFRRLETSIRRVRDKIFNIKKRRKYFKERSILDIIDIVTIAEKNQVIPEKEKYYYSKPQYYYEKKKLEFQYLNYIGPIFLKNVYIVGSSNFIMVNNNAAIYELYNLNKNKNFSYTDPSFVSEKEGVFDISYNESFRNIKTAINFCGNFSYNYYHLIFEIAAKFHYLEKYYIPNEIPIILDEVVGKTSQFKEIFDYFNKDNRKFLYVKRGYRHKIEELYFLPTLNFIPPDYVNLIDAKYSDCVFNLDSIKFIKNTLLAKVSTKKYGKRVFLSRKNSSARRKYNENEVIELFLKYDFEICYPEKLSISEQISLFNGAEFIAGVTGAAFTNLIFCSEGCKALCMMAYALDLSIFSTIAKVSGVDLQYYIAKDKNVIPNELHEKFVLDVDKLENVLVSFVEDRA